MPFDDDDLKRLKDSIEPETSKGMFYQALLFRLEAAEKALEKATGFFDMHPTRISGITQTGVHVFTDAYWAWRKAAGKDGV